MKIQEELLNKYKSNTYYNELTSDDLTTDTWVIVGARYLNLTHCYCLTNEYGTILCIPSDDFCEVMLKEE